MVCVERCPFLLFVCVCMCNEWIFVCLSFLSLPFPPFVLPLCACCLSFPLSLLVVRLVCFLCLLSFCLPVPVPSLFRLSLLPPFFLSPSTSSFLSSLCRSSLSCCPLPCLLPCAGVLDCCNTQGFTCEVVALYECCS